MKQFLKKQLLNIVFLMLIVGGALAVFLLSRTGKPALPSRAASATRTEASKKATAVPEEATAVPEEATLVPSGDIATPSPSPEPKQPKGVPEDVFTTHLLTSDRFDAKRSATDPHTWTLTYGDQPPVETNLQYTVDDGEISSLELAFLLPPEYNANSKSTIEQYLAKSKGTVTAARGEAVRALLPDLLPACDRNDSLSSADVRIWTEEMLQISSEKDDYRDKSGGYTFYAYQIQREDRNVLVCLLVLEQ